MARAIMIDLCGEEDMLTATRQDRPEGILSGLLAPDEAQVEVAYDDSTIVMPLAIKAIWDEWIGK